VACAHCLLFGAHKSHACESLKAAQAGARAEVRGAADAAGARARELGAAADALTALHKSIADCAGGLAAESRELFARVRRAVDELERLVAEGIAERHAERSELVARQVRCRIAGLFVWIFVFVFVILLF
jgi:hypothetical protein